MAIARAKEGTHLRPVKCLYNYDPDTTSGHKSSTRHYTHTDRHAITQCQATTRIPLDTNGHLTNYTLTYKVVTVLLSSVRSDRHPG